MYRKVPFAICCQPTLLSQNYSVKNSCFDANQQSYLLNISSMAMSKKDMGRKSAKKKAQLEELEKLAASGSGDAKKKLAKAKKKMK